MLQLRLWDKQQALLSRSPPWIRAESVCPSSGFWYLVEPTHTGYADLPDDAVVPVYPRQFIRVIVVGAQDQVPHIHGWTAAFDIQVSTDKWR